MPIEITYTALGGNGRRTPLGGTVLPVTTSATPGGAQPVTPSPSGTLITSIRSDVYARVDIAVSPDPAGAPSTSFVVGPGQPAEVRGRAGQKIAVLGVPAPDRGATADTRIYRTARAGVPKWSAIVAVGATECTPADPSDPTQRQAVLAVTAAGGATGATVTGQSTSDLTGDPAGWSPGDALFVGAGGALTTTPPSSGWRQQVATVIADGHIVVALGEARLVSATVPMLSARGYAAPATDADIRQGTAADRYIAASKLGTLAAPGNPIGAEIARVATGKASSGVNSDITEMTAGGSGVDLILRMGEVKQRASSGGAYLAKAVYDISGQVPAGSWDPTTNTPTLNGNNVGPGQDYYIVSKDGVSSGPSGYPRFYKAGDKIRKNGTFYNIVGNQFLGIWNPRTGNPAIAAQPYSSGNYFVVSEDGVSTVPFGAPVSYRQGDRLVATGSLNPGDVQWRHEPIALTLIAPSGRRTALRSTEDRYSLDAGLSQYGTHVHCLRLDAPAPAWATHRGIYSGLTADVGGFPAESWPGGGRFAPLTGVAGTLRLPADANPNIVGSDINTSAWFPAGVMGMAVNESSTNVVCGAYFSARTGVHYARAWGQNVTVSNFISGDFSPETGFRGLLYACENDVTLKPTEVNGDVQCDVDGIWMSLDSTGPITGQANAFHAEARDARGKWKRVIKSNPGATEVFAEIGRQNRSADDAHPEATASQKIQFISNSGAFQAVPPQLDRVGGDRIAEVFANAPGDLIFQPNRYHALSGTLPGKLIVGNGDLSSSVVLDPQAGITAPAVNAPTLSIQGGNVPVGVRRLTVGSAADAFSGLALAATGTAWQVDHRGTIDNGVRPANRLAVSYQGTEMLSVEVAGRVNLAGPLHLLERTKSTLPDPALAGNGSLITVTDESGGVITAMSDVFNWRRLTDRAVVS